jgi:hypothetical protein
MKIALNSGAFAAGRRRFVTISPVQNRPAFRHDYLGGWSKVEGLK